MMSRRYSAVVCLGIVVVGQGCAQILGFDEEPPPITRQNGAACAMANECASDLCVDGVCCDRGCEGTCEACNVPGNVGTCSNVPLGQADAVTCSGATEACDGAGACKKENGQSCAGDIDCWSNLCDSGACTEKSCIGLPANCGPQGNENCCVSGVVTGGSYNRSNNALYPATVDDFRLDRFEVTVGRFRKFVESYPSNKPSSGAGKHPLIAGSGWQAAWNGDLLTSRTALKAALSCYVDLSTWTDTAGANENLPMNCMSWYEAFAFCAWDGGRLPTEAEWNYAAVGGDQQRQLPWSYPPDLAMIDSSYAVYDCMGDGSAAGTCAFSDILIGGAKSPQGDGRWGQADLAGGMFEWTLDMFDTYVAPCDNCANVSTGTDRVVRGGSWYNVESQVVPSFRLNIIPSGRGPNAGLRCARNP